MLSDALANESGISVSLIVSRNPLITKNSIYKYNKAICIPKLLTRKGVYRFVNFFLAFKLLLWTIKKAKKRKKKVILFVRNEPVLLLASVFFRNSVSKLVFQSSFPHEENSKGLKSIIAKFIFRLCASRVDSLLSISPIGEKRLQLLFPSVASVSHIPLLAEKVVVNHNRISSLTNVNKLKFIYVGSHDKLRELNVVLEGIVYAVTHLKVRANFIFLGGNKNEIEQCIMVKGVKDLVHKNIITFYSKVERKKIWDFVINADIGLCLIPPKKIYIEASPTKLAEYLSCGLAVLANRGIVFQEKVIEDSKAGVLSEFNSISIASKIQKMTKDKEKLKCMRNNAILYSETYFSYKSYLNSFKKNVLNI